jgi:nicotinamide riboside kinase
MIVSFSGCQSSGKTTLLKHLQEKNPHINFIPEVTRLIQREYNVNINENGDTNTQILIISEHIKNILLNKDKNSILDRCSLDGAVYTTWLCANNKVHDTIACLAYTVFENTLNDYDIIFYTDPNDVEIEDDGVRSTDKTFRDDIILLFNHFIEAANSDKIITLSGTVEDRLKIIQSQIKQKCNIDISI